MIVALLLMMAMPMMAERVSPETAHKVATNFLNNNGAKVAQLTDLSKSAGFANLYIFNGEQGFVVMAADNCVQPILGYSLTGRFVAEDLPDNLNGWLQGYNDEIQYAIDNQMDASVETAKLWDDLAEGNAKAGRATVIVDALVQTTWDQNGTYYYSGGQLHIFELYNNLCPYDNTANERTVTGCVATAMAQIMKYWNYPSSGIGSHSYTPETRPDLGLQSANFGNTTYEWSNMPNQLTTSSTEAQINAIAVLMYHCGVSVDMMYDISGNGGSGAYSENIPNAMYQYFNYKPTANIHYKDNYTTNNWLNMLKTELNANRPIQYNGRGSGGHAFVCDGYNDNDQFHFNWGWSGSNDGFYSLTSLNPGSGGAGGGSYNFTNNQSAIIGIEPASTIAAPTNLTLTLAGIQDITLTWNAVSAAASYNVYRDGSLIGNTISTTYTETAPFGTHNYYVRCVDTNSQLSLPSNTVTITIDYLTPVVDNLTGTLSGNNVTLSWTSPEWCYPEEPSATLTYGDGNMSMRTSVNYWAHRYLADNLSQYTNKAVYKVSFYAYESGSYTCYIYKGATEQSYSGDNIFWLSTLLTNKTIEVTDASKWIDIDLDDIVTIDDQNDIWVVLYDPANYYDANTQTGRYSATFSTNTGNNNHGGYWGKWTTENGEKGYVLDESRAFLIKTYVTDGTYTYNLYDGTSTVAQNLSGTIYTVNNIANNAAHQFTLKTNYYGGETEASNMVGYTLGNASLTSLQMAADDQMTVTAGSTLTIGGTLANTNAANLILEDGAQLIHNSAGVKATVKKDIAAYTADDDGWNFIASPVTESITPSAENGLLANAYDLYKFDQSQDLEWRNYKTNPKPFTTLDHKTGYLYANSGNTSIEFAGTLAATTDATSLVYDDNAPTFKGFNLIGNPYPCNTTINKDYYVINGNTVTLAENGRVIAPCEAVFVQANGNNESVVFSKATARGNASSSSFDIILTQSTQEGRNGVSTSPTTLDRARVHLSSDERLEKFNLNGDKGSKLYIPQGNKDYAVVSTEGQTELPLNFKAAQNGTYTLAFETGSLELDYLHLVDNMTGTDIDLLSSLRSNGAMEYSFEAKTTDYASRFRLVFSNCGDAIGDIDTFAYYANGEIVIVGIGGDASTASLQVMDMTGRVVVSRDVARNVSTNGMAPGVYVLRLISGDTVKTQKIVIE